MDVKLLTTYNSIKDMVNFVAATCTYHDNDRKDFIPSEILQHIITIGHEGVLEHIYLTYRVEGVSQACLQELSQYRNITLSVDNTPNNPITGNDNSHDEKIITVFFIAIDHELVNDEFKCCIPEICPNNLILTANIRELRQIIKQQTQPEAPAEFRELALKLFHTVPNSFQYLLWDCLYQECIDVRDFLEVNTMSNILRKERINNV